LAESVRGGVARAASFANGDELRTAIRTKTCVRGWAFVAAWTPHRPRHLWAPFAFHPGPDRVFGSFKNRSPIGPLSSMWTAGAWSIGSYHSSASLPRLMVRLRGVMFIDPNSYWVLRLIVAWRLPSARLRGVPHWPQNFWVAGFFCWHRGDCGHWMSGLQRVRTGTGRTGGVSLVPWLEGVKHRAFPGGQD
jgi:hypothetical protein